MKKFRILVFVLNTLFVSGGHSNELVLLKAEMPQLIQNIVLAVDQTYISPVKAKEVSKIMLRKLRSGDFNQNYGFDRFAHNVTPILFKATADSGFEFILQNTIIETKKNTPLRKSNTSQHNQIKAEVLNNNIGYLRVTGDHTSNESNKVFLDQLKVLANVDALIIDLRLADKTTISIAQQMISYFIKPNITIGKVRFNDSEESLMSLDVNSAEKFKSDFPLYIVNSSFVAGEWEFFSHTLRHFNKAIIIGENTMGLGHFMTTIKVHDAIRLRMAYAEIIHPLNTQSWNNVGVIADYYIGSEQAFEKAYELALNRLCH